MRMHYATPLYKGISSLSLSKSVTRNNGYVVYFFNRLSKKLRSSFSSFGVFASLFLVDAPIKSSKLKTQAAIQGDEVRVSGKKRDELQETMAMIKELGVEFPLQFENFRD